MKKYIILTLSLFFAAIAFGQTYDTAIMRIKKGDPNAQTGTITRIVRKTTTQKKADKNNLEEFTSIRPLEMIRISGNDATATKMRNVVSGAAVKSKELTKEVKNYLKDINKELKVVETVDDLEVIMQQLSLVYLYNTADDNKTSTLSSGVQDCIDKVRSIYKKLNK